MNLGDIFSRGHGDFETLFHDTDLEQFVICFFTAEGEPGEFPNYKMIIGYTELPDDIMLHLVDMEGVDTFVDADNEAARHGVEFRSLKGILAGGGFRITPRDQLDGVLDDPDENDEPEDDCLDCNDCLEIDGCRAAGTAVEPDDEIDETLAEMLSALCDDPDCEACVALRKDIESGAFNGERFAFLNKMARIVATDPTLSTIFLGGLEAMGIIRRADETEPEPESECTDCQIPE